MPQDSPEQKSRWLIEHCVSCGHCRDLMAGSSCLFFPRLYRLHDRAAAGGPAISPDEMKHLLELCNTCGICPCPPVHAWIRQAKDAFIERDGLPWSTRLLEDVQLIGRLGSLLPPATNLLLGENLLGKGVKRFFRIHPERKLPRFPPESFGPWAEAQGLTKMPTANGRKVAYFSGCTARYMFPEVAKASVEILRRNGVAVYVPPQKCCGMPSMLEGDRSLTFALARANIAELVRCVEAGFDIVCSCPTCGYLLKSVLGDGAQFAPEYRSRVKAMVSEAKGDWAAVSARLAAEDSAFTGRVSRRSAHARRPWMLGLLSWKVFDDQGYFAELDAMDRLRVANHSYDLGEYLWELHGEGGLDLDFAEVDAEFAYFAPCHQRQQGIGQPWVDLLGLLPGARARRVGDDFDCCGLAGIMGFKQAFHKTSLAIGTRLANKLKAGDPGQLTTDCLSCRIQFQQTLSSTVRHPVEILLQAYRRPSPERRADAP